MARPVRGSAAEAERLRQIPGVLVDLVLDRAGADGAAGSVTRGGSGWICSPTEAAADRHASGIFRIFGVGFRPPRRMLKRTAAQRGRSLTGGGDGG